MRTAGWLAIVVIAFGSGYLIRDKLVDRAPARADSTAERGPEYRRSLIANLSDEEAEQVLKARYADLYRDREQPRAASQEPEPEPNSGGAEQEFLRGFKEAMQGQLPQWKSMMSVTAKRSGKIIAKKLEMDEQTVEKVSEAFDKEGARAAEQAMSIMMGEFEGDDEDAMAAFAWWMGTAGTMSDELALELSASLDDEQIGAIREEMRIRNKSDMEMQADMQIKLMTIPDLSDTQKVELKEMFSDGGMMKEQGRVWTELMKDPGKLVNAKTDEDWERLLAPAMVDNRRRMRAIFNDKQYEAYEAYEKRSIKNALVWIQPYLDKAK